MCSDDYREDTERAVISKMQDRPEHQTQNNETGIAPVRPPELDTCNAYRTRSGRIVNRPKFYDE